MTKAGTKWWDDAVVYQIYPRSFQDSDGDGVGDLRGIERRLDHVEWLRADAIWLSPIYPSPLADMGYDVADHAAVAPEMGTFADFDSLLWAAHTRGIRVVLDLVPSHTSIEHPWFREHPEYYVWSDDGPPNNWVAAFGGPAWSRDDQTGRWYLHSFYPEQPDLDWRVPAVREAIADVVRFWVGRGVDGFRVDALQQLMKHPELLDDPTATEPFALPLGEDYGRLRHDHSEAQADVGEALAAIAEAAGDALLVGEVYRPTRDLPPFLEHLDLAFSFDLLHSPFEAEPVARAVEAGTALGAIAWALSNHDFPRLASRFGPERAALAAVLLLTLPGPTFLYQGDEIGMEDGPGADPPIDRAGRDPHRHPMQWDASPSGGFTDGQAWLPPTDPATRNVADQRDQVGSVLDLHRRLIALRRELDGPLEMIERGPVLSYRRGRHIVALNFSDENQAAPHGSRLVLSTGGGVVPSDELRPGEGAIFEIG